MSRTWTGEEPPAPVPPLSPAGWLRVGLRGAVLASVIGVGLVLTILLRLVERPLFGLRRPVTPLITRMVCTAALRTLGIRLKVQGRPMREAGALVANHVSWLDIFVLNAPAQIYFVAKSEVASWAGIGWLARVTGTVFIARKRSEAQAQRDLFQSRLSAGHKLLFFPEGTSTDGRRVLAFNPTLFAAFFSEELRTKMHIQPVTVAYTAPAGQDPRFYGWWGDMSFGASLLQVLGARPQGRVEVIYHAPIALSEVENRKVLASQAGDTVRQALHDRIGAVDHLG